MWMTLCILLLLAVREYRLLPDGNLHLYILDIGQGDSILLVTPSGKQILIDGGPDLTTLERLGEYMPFFDRTIELVILSHPDADHLTALPDVLRRYKVEHILMTGAQHHSSRYEKLLAMIEEYNVRVILADPAHDISMGDGVILDVIWPPPDVFGTEPKNANDLSVVVRALYGTSSILLTGDIEEEAEHAILASGADVRSTVLKVPHHGSRTSSSTGFLLAVDPELALISAGRDNQFGHPHPDILSRYASYGIPTQNTGQNGTISLSFRAE